MRLILMGTGPFAVPSFEMTRECGHAILAVVCRPEITGSNPKKGPPPSPVRLWADEHSLPTHTPESINLPDSIAWLKSLHADLLLVCDYGQILSSDCLSTTRLGGINLHGSLLPRHRGAAPVQWSILSGDRLAGVSIIHMTPGLDAGPVLAQRSTEIQPHENSFELEKRLSHIGVDATRTAIQQLENSQTSSPVTGVVQNKALATKAPRLAKADGLIDANCEVRFLDRQVRGLQPWPGCYAALQLANGSALRLIIHKAYPMPISSYRVPQELKDSWQPGELIFGEKAKKLRDAISLNEPMHLGIVAKDGLFVLQLVQPAGKRPMDCEEFVRGYARQEWIRIESTPQSHPLIDRMSKLELPQ